MMGCCYIWVIRAMSELGPTINTCTELARSRLFRLEELDLTFSNGEQRIYERVCGHAHGSVMIVPLLDAGTVLLTREYAAGVDGYVLGFPKGACSAGEDVLKTANRELQEEAGYAAKRLTHLGRLSASPGYLDAMMDVVLAEDLYEAPEEGDEPEAIEVCPWPLDRVVDLLGHPEFHEARSIAAFFWVQHRLRHDG